MGDEKEIVGGKHSWRLIFVALVVVLCASVVACTPPNDSPNSSHADTPYPAKTRKTFLRACDKTADKAERKLEGEGEGRFDDSALNKWLGNLSDRRKWARSHDASHLACVCKWKWIHRHVDYRDFVAGEITMRSGGTPPDWMVDAVLACDG